MSEPAQDVDKISDDVKQNLQKIADNEGFVSYKVTCDKVAANGASILGIIHKAEIKGKDEKGEEKILHLFVKQTTQIITLCVSIDEAYKRETYFYSELKKLFEELQENANVPHKDRLRFVKSYVTNTEVIILEDQSVEGYKTLPPKSDLPLHYAEQAIKELAKLHGLSMVLEKQKPEYFDTKIKTLESLYKDFIYSDEYPIMYDNLFVNAKPFLKDETYKILESTMFDSYMDMSKRVYEPKQIFENCICHGDFKASNLLYKEIDGDIEDMIIIDYQLIYYGNPLNDFINIIYLGTDRKFRIKHMDHLKNLYYDNLKSYLKYFDLSLEDTFSREQFEIQFKDLFSFAMFFSLTALPFIFSCDDKIPDLGKESITDMCFKVDSRIENRVQEIAEEFIEFNNIKG